MRFELKAVNQDGQIVSLDYHGLGEAGVVQQAESHGYSVLAVHSRRVYSIPLRVAQEQFELGIFSQELPVLIDAGVPLIESIQSLAKRERRKVFRTLLEQIVATVRQGNTFSS